MNSERDEWTKGWERRSGGDYEKNIGEQRFQCLRMSSGNWYLMAGVSLVKKPRPTLRECQILAHETARLWAGESE